MHADLRRAAFFDVDNTLINSKSMFSFQAFYLDHWLPNLGLGGESFDSFSSRLMAHPTKHDRQFLNRRFYESYAGFVAADVREAAFAWFESVQAELGEALWIQAAVEFAQQLRRNGYLLVAVSGSAPEILAPIIEALGFDHCLATRLEQEGGTFTGRILPPQMIGDGKAIALKSFALAHRVDLAGSTACGDHISDLPMLECVTDVAIVAGDPELETIALARGWRVLSTPSAASHNALAHV